MLEYQLFFGRGSVADQAWAEFAADVVTPHLPDGFTVLDAEGQWMNPATHRISSERTKVIVVAVPDTAGQRCRDRGGQGRLSDTVLKCSRGWPGKPGDDGKSDRPLEYVNLFHPWY